MNQKVQTPFHRILPVAVILLIAEPVFPNGQTHTRPESPLIPEEHSWTVDLNSSGEFHGKAGGGAHITSKGIVYVSRFNVLSTLHRPCRSQLPKENLRQIAQVVSSTKASTWKSSYVPDGDNGCCDRFHWTLLLFQRALDNTGHTYGSDWYDGNETRLPDDLAELRKIVIDIMKTALGGCKQ